MDLRGRTALVTGGAKRVGAAIALRLARAGCNIALHYHRSAEEAESTAEACRAVGVEAHLIRADLRHPPEVERIVPNVVSLCGRLDILVNNASTFERMSLGEFDLARWNETIGVNLTAPFLLARHAAAPLRSAGGRIINLCDVGASRPWPAYLAYCVSKAALEALTRGLARELAPDVTVVGIAPGVAAWPESYDMAKRDRLVKKIPLGRAGTPDDIAAAVEFVLRDGDYITGAIIPIDGGRNIS